MSTPEQQLRTEIYAELEQQFRTEIEHLQLQLDQATANSSAEDTYRLEMMAEIAARSYTGISFVLRTKGSRHDTNGFQMMWHHRLNDPQPTLRRAIDHGIELFLAERDRTTAPLGAPQ